MPTLKGSNFLLERLRDFAVASQHFQRTNLARLVIRSDVDHGQALSQTAHTLAIAQSVMLRLRQHTQTGNKPLSMRFEGLDEECIDAGQSSTPRPSMFSLCSHARERNAMPAQVARSSIAPVTDDEIDEVLTEFAGDAREAIRALLHDQAALVADADRSVSRGYLRGLFSNGARPMVVDDEP